MTDKQDQYNTEMLEKDGNASPAQKKALLPAQYASKTNMGSLALWKRERKFLPLTWLTVFGRKQMSNLHPDQK